MKSDRRQQLTSLLEAPIDSYTTVGDFSKELSFKHPVDRALVTSPAGIAKIKAQWARTPVPFDIYMVNRRSVNQSKFFEQGAVPLSFVRNQMKLGPNLIPDPRSNAITILFTNNEGAERVMMTGWTMAHRFGHALNASQPRLASWEWFLTHLRQLFDALLKDVYGDDQPRQDSARFGLSFGRSGSTSLNLLTRAAKMLGTMRSARAGTLRDWGEFGYELLAQYLLTGRIKLNPLPALATLKFSYYNPISHEAEPAAQQSYNEKAIPAAVAELEQLLRTVLDDAVGKIFVM